MKQLALILVAILPAVVFASDPDTSLWQHNTNLKWNDFKLQHRLVDDIDYEHVDLSYRFYKSDGDVSFINLGSKYAGSAYTIHHRRTDTEGADKDEHRTYLTIEPAWKFDHKVKLSYKSYFEHRDIDNKDEYFRYRGKLKLSKSYDKYSVYASDRLAWSDEKDFEGNEFEVGAKVKLTPVVSLATFYRYSSDDEWDKKEEVVGTHLTFSF